MHIHRSHSIAQGKQLTDIGLQQLMHIGYIQNDHSAAPQAGQEGSTLHTTPASGVPKVCITAVNNSCCSLVPACRITLKNYKAAVVTCTTLQAPLAEASLTCRMRRIKQPRTGLNM